MTENNTTFRLPVQTCRNNYMLAIPNLYLYWNAIGFFAQIVIFTRSLLHASCVFNDIHSVWTEMCEMIWIPTLTLGVLCVNMSSSGFEVLSNIEQTNVTSDTGNALRYVTSSPSVLLVLWLAGGVRWSFQVSCYHIHPTNIRNLTD